MKSNFYIIILLTVSLFTFSIFSQEIKIENKAKEEIINDRMKKMSTIGNLTQKIYKQLNSANFKIIMEQTIKLKDTAIDFNNYFPINSKGGKAKNLIWENKKLFDEYNSKFINDINLMLIDIEENNIVALTKNFTKMSSNCASCHKKFKNK